MGAVDEAQKHNKKFSLLGVNVGPTRGGRTRSGDFTFSGRGRFFSPFGGDGTHAVQAQGEYMYYPGRQEGQFDIGLVNRWGNLQAGAFGSFKYINYKQYQNGGTLGQAAFLLDYIFSRGRIGVFGTQGFKNYAVLNSVTLAPGAYIQTYARVVNQYGVQLPWSACGATRTCGQRGLPAAARGRQQPTAGAQVQAGAAAYRHVAFTAEADYNET